MLEIPDLSRENLKNDTNRLASLPDFDNGESGSACMPLLGKKLERKLPRQPVSVDLLYTGLGLPLFILRRSLVIYYPSWGSGTAR